MTLLTEEHLTPTENAMIGKVEKLKKAAYEAMNAYQAAEAVERDKYNKAMIGKCFKYSNSGGGCDERWWLYVKVTRLDDGHLRVFKFEQLPNGCISIEPDQFSYSGTMGADTSGYIEIDPSEFEREFAKLRETINGYPRS